MIKKIIRYRLLIFQTIYLLCKHILMRVILPNKILLDFVFRQHKSKIPLDIPQSETLHYSLLLRTTNKILKLVYPNGNCLVKSLVKRGILQKYGYSEHIILGVKYTEQELKAHAWLSSESGSNFNILHLV